MTHGGFVEYTIIFSNVHKKHQFAELFNLEDINVNMLAKVPGIFSEEQLSELNEPKSPEAFA